MLQDVEEDNNSSSITVRPTSKRPTSKRPMSKRNSLLVQHSSLKKSLDISTTLPDKK